MATAHSLATRTRPTLDALAHGPRPSTRVDSTLPLLSDSDRRPQAHPLGALHIERHDSGWNLVQCRTAQSAVRSSALIVSSGLSAASFMMPRWGSTR